jgi:acetate kinase
VCQELLPGAPQVAVFDTAFHQTMPPEAYLYAIPMALYAKLKIRKYGFHGTSHKYVSEQAARVLGRPLDDLKIITCHLGNGASMAAVQGGKSVDTSMGFTPLEGLVMGTRCGDIDPACVTHIMYEEKLSPTQVDDLLNKKSGMLGLCEATSDMRDIENHAMEGLEKFRLALDIYCRRIRKYVGAYAAVLGGVDALVFTAGVGENSPIVRRMVCEDLGFLGVRLDEAKNERSELIISTGSVAVLVIPTNEELAIARDTIAVIGDGSPNIA